ncbi:MAG: hypothetical protein WCC90_17330, partial [Methylocella sp.]
TRYPFLWNAARQDKTQWPGFAKNGIDLLGLARNLGEVYGVFGGRLRGALAATAMGSGRVSSLKPG